MEAKKIVEKGELFFYNKMEAFDNLINPIKKEKEEKEKIPEIKKENIRKFDAVIDYLNRNHVTLEAAEKFDCFYCNQGYFKGYLVIPIYDVKGLFVSYEFRLVCGEGVQGKKVLYNKNFKTSNYVFNLNNINDAKKIIIVEGAKDVMRFKSIGLDVISCFGAKISKNQIGMILDFNFENIFILYDPDDTGIKKAEKLKKIFINYINTYNITPIEGKHPCHCTDKELKKITNKYDKI